MANYHRCGGCGRRNSNNIGCLDSVNSRWRSPIYGGPCPDVDGDYGDDCRRRHDRVGDCGDTRRCDHGCVYGLFTASQPIAAAANGVIPLSRALCSGGDFAVNSGMITARREGTYLAIYTVRVPAGTELNTTTTLNVNDAQQTSAIAAIDAGATDASSATTAQAILDIERGDTLTLRTLKPINVAATSAQPMFTLSLVRLDG